MGHFESFIYQQASIINPQIQRQRKPTDLVFKMSVLSFPTVQHMQSYNAIYPSNIPDLFVSAHRSRPYLPKYIQFQMRYISTYIPPIFTIPMPLESHESLLENDGIAICVRSIHTEKHRDLSIEHSVHIAAPQQSYGILICSILDFIPEYTSKFINFHANGFTRFQSLQCCISRIPHCK